MKDGFLTISEPVTSETVISRSRFICHLSPVDNEDDARFFVERIKKEHSLATHNCYAYVADEYGLVQKFSDDGEPQGTSGMPMLEVLKNKGLSKVVAVVTRYFGGVKLGAGGLVRAYSGAVANAISVATLKNMRRAVFVCVKSDYDKFSRLNKLENEDTTITDRQFSDGVIVKYAVKYCKFEDFKKQLSDIFSGKEVFEIVGEEYFPF